MNTRIGGMSTTFMFNIQTTNTVFKKETENLTNAGGKKKPPKIEVPLKTRKLRKLQKNIEKFYQILRFSEVSHWGRA